MRHVLTVSLIWTVAAATGGSAQEPVSPVDATPPRVRTIAPLPEQLDSSPSGYVLGPGDVIVLYVTDVDEFNNKIFRIDTSGEVNFPVVGRFHTTGVTIQELEQQVQDRLKKFVRDPQVVVHLNEAHSQPVSVL